jgi:hypothetical protein
MKRLATVLFLVVGLALLSSGAALVWVDARLDDAPARTGEVVLSGWRVTDVDVPVEDSDRVTAFQVLTLDRPAPIGSPADIQVIDQPLTVGRLVGDDRIGTWGLAVGGTGAVCLLATVAVIARARRRRRRDATSAPDAGSRPPASTALVTLLLLSGCTWTGDSVDRDAYRAARTAVAAAFPVAANVDPPPAFGTPVSEPVADPESAVPVILAAAGLPQDPSTTTAARFVARQLFDPAMLCERAPIDPLLELLVPGLAAQVGHDEANLAVRIHDCAGLRFDDMRVGVAAGAVEPGLWTGGAGTTVTLTVSAVFSTDAGGAAYTVEREVRLGMPEDQPDRIIAVTAPGADAGAGIGTSVLPDPAAFPAWDEELLPGPAQPDPNSAAAVIRALAATLAEDTLALGLSDDWVPADEEPDEYTGSGHMAPASGEAQLTFQHPEVRELRVLGHHRRFLDNLPATDSGETWRQYLTAEEPRLYESSFTSNPFAVLDWLRHLSAAAPTDCPEGVDAEHCHAVEVPTSEILTPGTPGYREAVVHARRGNPSMMMVVGVTDGRLAAVVLSRKAFDADGKSSRGTSIWTFAPWEAGTPAPLVERPPSWTEIGA